MSSAKLEEVFGHIGQWGQYQRRVFSLICLFAIPCGVTAISWVFIGAVPKHRCFLPSVDTDAEHISYNLSSVDYEANIPFELNAEPNVPELAANRWLRSQCMRYNPPLISSRGENNVSTVSAIEKCSRFVYDYSVYFHGTVATEFNLVCDDAWKHSLVQSLYMVGILIGSFLVGELADRIGRKPALVISTVLAAVVGILNYLSRNFTLFAVTRCLQGVFLMGFYLMSVVLGMELVGPDKRIFAGMMISSSFAIGEILVGVLAYLVRDWRMLQLITSAPILVYFAGLYFVPESVRWLYSKRSYEKAELILEQIAFENGVELDRRWLLEIRQSGERAAETEAHDETERPRGRFCFPFEILFHAKIRKWFAVQLLCWFVASMVYYGLSMETQSLGGNDFTNSVLVSAIELPTYVILLSILDSFGRRIPLLFCFTLSGLACFGLAIFPLFIPMTLNGSLSLLSFALLGKAGISAAFAICYIYAAELFPTTFRSQALGLCAMIGHAGPIFSPFIALLGSYDKALPYLIFGTFGMAAALSSPVLPETAGSSLPETVQEAEMLGSARRPRSRSDQATSGESIQPLMEHDLNDAEDEPLLRPEIRKNDKRL